MCVRQVVSARVCVSMCVCVREYVIGPVSSNNVHGDARVWLHSFVRC